MRQTQELSLAVDFDGPTPIVTVTSDTEGVLYAGPLPPIFTELPAGESFPGVDIDVAWTLHHAQLGEIQFRQAFRNGIEVAEVEAPAPVTFEVTMPYAAMLEILYEGRRFGDFFAADEAIVQYPMLSCVSGLIHTPNAPRYRSLPRPVIDVLAAWSLPSD